MTGPARRKTARVIADATDGAGKGGRCAGGCGSRRRVLAGRRTRRGRFGDTGSEVPADGASQRFTGAEVQGQHSGSGGKCLWWTRGWWSGIWEQGDVTSVSACRHGHGVLMLVILWNKTGSTRTHGSGHGSGWLGECGRKCG
ncbi:uncharacterized protein M6B38_162650 [Iris pallida]|uniref:Uncharacterized protein n=1 Tax=Iris pallida TaxID=29817 RepID=A0AAX6F012_IRIPA|nr:uncharacterized protein M6B38_162650 [Iris pallida]